MKILRFLIVLAITSALIIFLSKKTGNIPPLGKFLDPFHGFWQNISPQDLPENMLSLPLNEPVTVQFDEHLIPHIYAKNDVDLYTAQGYITAFYRLFQLEAQTRASNGSLSEMFGTDLVDYDQNRRKLGLNQAAKEAMEVYSKYPEVMAQLNAYSNGVNAHISQLRYKNLPVEFKLLDFAPTRWNPEKTANLLVYMSYNLSGYDEDMEYTNALQLFGRSLFDSLYALDHEQKYTVMQEQLEWPFEPISAPEKPENYFIPILDSLTTERPNPENGSNNFAISGAKSSSGYPILANDPHLGLNLPSIWMIMHLSAPGTNAMGATLPGALGVISGFNNEIAWGMTNATRDVKDWYSIELNEDMTSYKYDGSWMPLQPKEEVIRVRGGKDIVDTVYYTHHGPVVFAAGEKGHGRALAVQWAGAQPYLEQKAILEINKSANFGEFQKSLSYYNTPSQNFIFASREGDIGLEVGGLFPVKWEEQGKFVQDGSVRENDWQMIIPREHAVSVLNPEQQFISSANQRPVDDNYPYYVFSGNYQHYRNRIIIDFLDTLNNADIDDFKALQNNNYSLKAEEFTTLFLSKIDRSSLTADQLNLLNVLEDWDYSYNSDQKAPAVFNNWLVQVKRLAFEEIYENKINLPAPSSYKLYLLLQEAPNLSLWNNEKEKIDNVSQLVTVAFQKTSEEFNADSLIEWGTYKSTTIQHLMAPLSPFHRITSIGGDSDITNATSKRHGASWRFIATWDEEGVVAEGIYPGGQSGHPSSKYYDNFIPDWEEGNYRKLSLDPPVVEERQVIFIQKDKK